MFKDTNTKMLVKQIVPFVEPDEEIIIPGMFEAKSSFISSALSMGLSNRFHIIAVTNKRVLILPLSKTTTKPIKKDVYSVDYDQVRTEKNAIYINDPKNNKPVKFAFKFGIGSLSGLSKEEFISELEKRQKK